ncbi:MAG: glycosyltransferase [Candidatus Competibacterales bacterium]|nr:glycosyltransferase [Candidatus Competibacterales bacterium]
MSVLLPVRAGNDWLLAAVASILDQTLRDLELIVIDDGDNQGVLPRLPPDPRLRIVRSAGRGIVAALNSGAAAARGLLLARMDADDLALPERLQQQVELLEREPAVGIVGARVEIFTDSGPPRDGYRRYQDWLNGLTEPEAIRRELYVESPIPHPTAMLGRSLFARLGGYRDRPWAEDYDLWLRADAAGVAMAKPAPVLLHWRDHPQRLSRSQGRYDLTGFTRAKAHFLARTRLRERAAVIWGACPTGARLFDALRDEGVTVGGFIDIDPKKIGGRKRGLPVWPPTAATETGDALILGAVGAHGARASIRAALQALDRQEGRDFLFTA